MFKTLFLLSLIVFKTIKPFKIIWSHSFIVCIRRDVWVTLAFDVLGLGGLDFDP